MSAHRGYSTWDLKRIVGRRAPFKDRKPGESASQARCRARVAAVEGVVNGCEAQAGLSAVDLTARRAYWQHRLSLPRSPQEGAAFANRSVNRMVLHALGPMLIFCAFLIATALGPVPFGRSAVFSVLVFFIVPIAIIPFVLGMRPRFRLMRSLAHSACPDCAYSLSELPDAIELPDGVRSGPAVCPECGCPWPLVPPGVPHDGGGAHGRQ